MEKNIRHIILDISVNKYIPVLVKQYNMKVDSIIATITNNGKPYILDDIVVPRVKCKKADGTCILNDCVILENGNISIEVTEQMTACEGHHNCELLIVNGDTEQVLHTMSFTIIVKESVCSDEEITSSNEFLSLENALLSLDKIRRITENEIDALFV